MAPFSIPAPQIIPWQLVLLGRPKSIDTNTKIHLLCDTYLEHEIFYTIDGTKPQPYVGIVQGSKTFKYSSPFCLPPGKIIVKAVAINANFHSMCSNVITKCFDVLKAASDKSAKRKVTTNIKKKHDIQIKNSCKNFEPTEIPINQINSKFDLNQGGESNADCFDEAFIASTELETESDTKNSDMIEDVNEQSFNSDISENYVNEDIKPGENIDILVNKDSALAEYLQCEEENTVDVQNATFAIDNSTSTEPQFCCLKCDVTLQQCISCKKMNTISSKFCIECGKQLAQICTYCKENNPSVATFCKFCGKKLDLANNEVQLCLKVDNSIIAKPQLKNVGIQKLPILLDKSTQTIKESSLKKSSPKLQMKKLPQQSPGRGYWHQQLDYICNHLKSHAYNNLDFRKMISEPMLCDFQSAHINKDENSVTVTLIFSQLVIDKNSISTSEDVKKQDS